MSGPGFELIKRMANKLGIAISRYPPRYPPFGSFGWRLGDLLSKMEINVVLDVGAYIGNYAKELRRVGYQGRIISFEPVPASFEQLSATMRNDPLWSGQPMGLSDEDREALINSHTRGDFNSLLNLRGDSEQAYSVDSAGWTKTPISLRRLDSVLPELIKGIPSPRIFLKIDTQGHDVSVVKGAPNALSMILGIQSELPAVELYDGMHSMSAVLSYYASCNFVPIGFYSVNELVASDGINLSPEFDVLFRRFDGRLSTPGTTS